MNSDLESHILHADVQFFDRSFRKPLLLSAGPISQVTEARTTVTVRAGGREVTGRGAIYLSDLWAWPDPAIPHPRRDAALRELCTRIARDLPSLCGGELEHPLELGLRLHHAICREPMPPVLARAMCASPFDAAIHDAVGVALGRSAFNFYEGAHPIPSADALFPSGGACAAITRLLRPPLKHLDGWWIVGAADSLENDVAPAVRERRYRGFKLKIHGRNNADDAARTAEVFRAVKAMGVARPRLTADSNEANQDAASVLDYLERLRSTDAEAFVALEYLEQPTARDIIAHPQDWRAVTRLKPVLLDEGLTDFDRFEESVRQGWSGFALKTCKGHSFALVAAAWAREHRLPISLQDLTNPGLSAIHAALFAAHVPTINGVELNACQFTPSANDEWLPRLQTLLDPRDGTHRIDLPVPDGLGSGL
jgi:L-alanine-DL-glutamate epimerase-like enolase superfamily enzyme